MNDVLPCGAVCYDGYREAYKAFDFVYIVLRFFRKLGKFADTGYVAFPSRQLSDDRLAAVERFGVREVTDFSAVELVSGDDRNFIEVAERIEDSECCFSRFLYYCTI